MSRQLALDTIHLKPTPRWAHTDYSMEYHTPYLSRITGLPPGHPDMNARFYDAWDFDFLWHTHDGLHADWKRRGRATDMGHAAYASDGGDQRAAAASPFQTVEEVWDFDAVREYGLPEADAQTAAYQSLLDGKNRAHPGQLVTGGYYKTLVSGAIEAFGWEMFLMAASDLRRIERTLDSIFRFTLFHMQAWARTDVPVIIQHDDFVWTSGPFLDPAFYRSAIIPRYAELWKPLRAAGKKILFCSDGTFTEFAADILAAGADGLIFEPSNDFGFMAERFGDSACLVGSFVDCRDMTLAPWETVRAQIDRTAEVAARCRGLIVAVGNHIPANISDEMCDRYIGHWRERWIRG